MSISRSLIVGYDPSVSVDDMHELIELCRRSVEAISIL